ncbi:MAG: uroporphyrinogen-III synthase [Rikenellaceae bacterium]|nr:uroporphyrinogen-III synthase [Rikenellaceae bacterium]MBQ5372116.1 uroporphyrinogen-III synthase [Rikenellaceae bacterium]MBQ5853715.1 uroporphyrinogen-III synthase [Rikenellaceae bacterium]
MSIKKILVSQPQPAIIEKSPFFEIVRKHKVDIDYNPFNRVQGVSLKEFMGQRVEILTHTAVIFTSRTTVDSFFRICEESRITVPETMKYICQTEAVALYLQKYIVYRKRKIFFADGSFTNFLELIIKHKEEKYMLALSEPHKPELPEALERLKLNVDQVILAKTVQTDVSKLPLAEYDMVALYSPSDVAAFKSAYEDKPMPRVATFGDATARAAVAAGITINVMAPTPAAPSMTKAIDIYLNKLATGEEVAPIELHDDQNNEEFIRTQQAKLAKKTRVRKSATAAAAAPAKKGTATKKEAAKKAPAKTATKATTAKKTTTTKSTTKKTATVKAE